MFLQSPYYQHFCGRLYFEHQLPIDPSSLVRWRKRVGEAGMEEMLLKSIEAAVSVDLVKPQSFTQVIVDTTVMEKAITHPTDSKLLEKSRCRLVKLAQKEGINLRQNYNRVAPRQAIQTGRYAHAKQYTRMKKSLKTQRTWLGRVVRDIERKASVVTTHKEGLVIGMRTMPGNPYDGHTLAEALEQKEILTNTPTERVFVDKGYRGHSVTDCDVYISGQKRNMTTSLKRKLKRRSAIEPTIGHMKTEGRLDRCTLKGQIGDAMFALLCAAGHNLRLILNFLRNFWHYFLAMLCFTSTPNFKG
jgi:IS5 family transposase